MPWVTRCVAFEGFVGSEVVLAFIKLQIAKIVIEIPILKIIMAVTFCPAKVKLPIVRNLSMTYINNPNRIACAAGGILSFIYLFTF